MTPGVSEGTMLELDRYCTEIVAQTDLLRSHVRGADMNARVPSCPGWDLGQLLRHLGGAHRWVETIVGTRAQQPVSEELVDAVAGSADVLDGWLAEGANRLAETLRDAGPDVEVWTVVPGQPSTFWARRMTHETVLHRFDAAFTVGADFAVAADVAADALDEWMTFGTSHEAMGPSPGEPDLLGAGRSLHFHATDTKTEAEWLVDLTGDTGSWRRAHERATVAVRGALTDLLLLVYDRPGVRDRVEIRGDAALLDRWRHRAASWLEED